MEKSKNMNNTAFIVTKGTMTIETFTDMVKDKLSSHIRGCTLEVQETKKNNGVILHGIRIREPESNIAPVVYMDDYFKEYQSGRFLDEIVIAVAENYKKNRVISDFDTMNITDYERVKERICFKVVNTDLNRELLCDVPHVPFCDLSVVFYVLLDSIPGQSASVMVNNRFMDIWGVDTDTLFEKAMYNTPRLLQGKVTPMRNIIESILKDRDDRVDGLLPDLEKVSMYVATNEMKSNGASVFLYDSLLSGFADRIGKDFFIIPSSIHELIFLPDDLDMEPEDIRGMIFEVNMTCVEPEEVLSNNVYRYRRETRGVEIA